MIEAVNTPRFPRIRLNRKVLGATLGIVGLAGICWGGYEIYTVLEGTNPLSNEIWNTAQEDCSMDLREAEILVSKARRLSTHLDSSNLAEYKSLISDKNYGTALICDQALSQAGRDLGEIQGVLEYSLSGVLGAISAGIGSLLISRSKKVKPQR